MENLPDLAIQNILNKDLRVLAKMTLVNKQTQTLVKEFLKTPLDVLSLFFETINKDTLKINYINFFLDIIFQETKQYTISIEFLLDKHVRRWNIIYKFKKDDDDFKITIIKNTFEEFLSVITNGFDPKNTPYTYEDYDNFTDLKNPPLRKLLEENAMAVCFLRRHYYIGDVTEDKIKNTLDDVKAQQNEHVSFNNIKNITYDFKKSRSNSYNESTKKYNGAEYLVRDYIAMANGLLKIIPQQTGSQPNKIHILGRDRVLRKEGNKCMIIYNKQLISVQDARKLEKRNSRTSGKK